MATLSSSVFRGSRVVVHVCLHDRSFPGDGEWQRLVDDLVTLRSELAGTDRHRSLVLSDGGAPTSAQREVLKTAVGDEKIKVALVTSSRLALGIGAAVGHRNALLRSFAPEDFLKALRYLDVPEADRPLLLTHLDEVGQGLAADTIDAIKTRALRSGR